MLEGIAGEWDDRGPSREDATGDVFMADTPGSVGLDMAVAVGAGLYCGVGRVVETVVEYRVGEGRGYEYRRGLGLSIVEAAGLGRMCARVML